MYGSVQERLQFRKALRARPARFPPGPTRESTSEGERAAGEALNGLPERSLFDMTNRLRRDARNTGRGFDRDDRMADHLGRRHRVRGDRRGRELLVPVKRHNGKRLALAEQPKAFKVTPLLSETSPSRKAEPAAPLSKLDQIRALRERGTALG
jgi:hypothetical protein